MKKNADFGVEFEHNVKTTISINALRRFAWLAGCCLAFMLASAAENGANAPSPTKPAEADGQPRAPGARASILDERQREAFLAEFMKHSDQVRRQDEQIRDIQAQMLKLMVAPTFDEKLLREKVEAAAKIQVEQTMLRAKIFSSVVPLLTEDQKKQLAEAPPALFFGGSTVPRSPAGRPGAPASGSTTNTPEVKVSPPPAGQPK